ncbi:Six-hairpin glycosidase-like protein [Aspergillus multicolor]|uniref:Six-hairpin glycosidase-like protein n=1 Tax=Aspergillus multicolor TaxID=41759 RepID=UPI003CCD6E4F
MLLILSLLVGACLAQSCWRGVQYTGPLQPAFPGPWESNIYAPTSRTVQPKAVLSLPIGELASEYTFPSKISFDTNIYDLVFDFGLEVGGLVTVKYILTSPPTQLGLAFTEAKGHIGRVSDSSRGGDGDDKAIFANLGPDVNGTYTMPHTKLRGGFCYLTLFLPDSASNSTLTITNGNFHSSDELLNKICGMRTPSPNTLDGWDNIEVIRNEDTVLVDGAKRDRLIWTGDMGTALPSVFVNTGELDSARSALAVIFANQADNGQFPKAEPPNDQLNSDTYHLWQLIGTYNYLLYSGDAAFVVDHWPQFTKGLNRSLSLLSSNGIVKVTADRDWGRFTYGAERASASILFDENIGAFKDSPDSDLYPQDANSLALAYGVISSSSNSSQARRISDYLTTTWTPIEPSCPELLDNVSPFISSIELDAHFKAGRPDRALTLIRDLWGWYLDHENGTQSTTPGGFTVDGTWEYRLERSYTKGSPYLSHSHGWSSGPTSTLTEYMLGLRVTKPAGEEWVLAPAGFTDLHKFEGGFAAALGKFSASVKVDGKYARVNWETPRGTKGVVYLPGQKPFRVRGGKGSRRVRI